jgi:hypothetical protein
VGQAVRPQAAQRFDRMAGEQELLHLVEEPRRRDVLDQRRIRDRGGPWSIELKLTATAPRADAHRSSRSGAGAPMAQAAPCRRAADRSPHFSVPANREH